MTLMDDGVIRFRWWTTGSWYTRPWSALQYLMDYDLDSVSDLEACRNRDQPYLWLNHNRILFHIEWDAAARLYGAARVVYYLCFVDKAEAAKFKLYFPNYEALV